MGLNELSQYLIDVEAFYKNIISSISYVYFMFQVSIWLRTWDVMA